MAMSTRATARVIARSCMIETMDEPANGGFDPVLYNNLESFNMEMQKKSMKSEYFHWLSL
jgi:ABC-type transporter Mla maintaining outer membrane lipid asymmetry ATPase subunit MlaF